MTDNSKKTVLIIDDEPNNIDILTMDLEEENYRILTAEDGEKGWQLLQEHADDISVILLDRMMPNMDGMQFMEKLKHDELASKKPVIMQTAAAEKTQVAEGINAGVYYYLTKPYDVNIMRAIVRAAIKDYEEVSQLQDEISRFHSKIKIVKESFFEITTLDDVKYLSTFLANYYPDAQRVVLGLTELFVNGIEHGNLGITYEEKSQLMLDNNWEEEVNRRLELEENKHKKVVVHFKREDDHIYLHIKDQGQGFDWQKYLQISPKRATDSHGRGIALTHMISFDSIEYQGIGNEVVCKVML